MALGGRRALRCFTRIAEVGSFSAVARENGSSASAVNRQIAQLEAHFAIRLQHRAGPGHDPRANSYPQAIRTELGRHVRHRASRYLTNRVEQDQRGIKGRYRSMRGSKCVRSATRFCRGYDEFRNFPRPRPHHYQPVSANHRRLHVLCAATTAISVLAAA
jgi:hypothetical protein